MYTDFEIERISLGLIIPSSNGNGAGADGNGEKDIRSLGEDTAFSHEELERLCLGLPFS